jgi:hypothetical protein
VLYMGCSHLHFISGVNSRSIKRLIDENSHEKELVLLS